MRATNTELLNQGAGRNGVLKLFLRMHLTPRPVADFYGIHLVWVECQQFFKRAEFVVVFFIIAHGSSLIQHKGPTVHCDAPPSTVE